MRRLEAGRLVQWYHFQDEVFPIGSNCLLVGEQRKRQKRRFLRHPDRASRRRRRSSVQPRS